MYRVPRIALLTTICSALLSSATINYNPAPVTDTGWNTCSAFPQYSCRTTAYFDPLTLNDQNDSQNINGLFQTAFTAWNASGGGQGWTLNFGGDVDGTFDVTIAKAMQFDAANNPVNTPVFKGGLEIEIKVTNITLPTLGAGDSLVWSQGLFDNYTGAGATIPPIYEMDITAAACNTNGANPWCPPAYPFTYPTNHFYDRPAARYQLPPTTQAFFDTNAYLSVINYGTKTLTVYDGVSYGFQNQVSPEPSTWIFGGTGLLMLLVLRKRRSV
jgi:hypothetical protein